MTTTMSDVAVLSTHALSRRFQSEVERRYGQEIGYHALVDVRRGHTLLNLLRLLRRIAPKRLVVIEEDEASALIIPVLQIVAAATGSSRIELLSPDLTVRPLSRLGAIGAGMSVIGATIEGAMAVLRAKWECSRLLAAAPRAFPVIRRGPVLYLNTYLWLGAKTGGSVGHVAGVVNGLQRLGWPVTLASTSGAQLVDAEVAVVPLRLPHAYGFPPHVNHYRLQRRLLRQLEPVVATLRPTLIYQRMSVGDYTGVELSRKFGVPLVLEYNGASGWVSRFWGWDVGSASLATRAEDVCLRHAHRVCTVSEVLTEDVVARGVRRERVIWYPNCVDERLFDPTHFPPQVVGVLRQRLGLDKDDVVITFVGTFGQWHGVEVLARAAARLVTHERAWLDRYRVRFVFIGDGVMMPEVRRVLDIPESARYVRLTGLVAQAEAPAYLAASDILASPHVPNVDGSRFFGSPTKLFEYMAMGRAIIASRLEQLNDVLSPGLDGGHLQAHGLAPDGEARALLVEPANIDQLINGLRFLVERPEWRAHLGAHARRAASQKYLWRHHVEHLLDGLTVAAPA